MSSLIYNIFTNDSLDHSTSGLFLKDTSDPQSNFQKFSIKFSKEQFIIVNKMLHPVFVKCITEL